MSLDIRPLFQPLEVKGRTIRNRIVMPPMVSNRLIVGHDGVEWYQERADGGAGLIIVEATAVNRFGEELTPENLRGLVEAIHEAGALAAIQLFPVTFGTDLHPADLSAEQIQDIIQSFEKASEICAGAGFDGVEPHGAHGYLLNQFFSPADNDRKDEFGGCLENRMRMGLEIVRASRKGLGDGRILLYRHTPLKEESYTIEESVEFTKRLIDEGVDILDISPASDKLPADHAEPFRALGVPVIAVNKMDEAERALEALEQGRADLIAVGRGLIADPLWPEKVKDGRFDEIVDCTRCNEGCFGNLRAGIPIECVMTDGQ